MLTFPFLHRPLAPPAPPLSGASGRRVSGRTGCPPSLRVHLFSAAPGRREMFQRCWTLPGCVSGSVRWMILVHEGSFSSGCPSTAGPSTLSFPFVVKLTPSNPHLPIPAAYSAFHLTSFHPSLPPSIHSSSVFPSLHPSLHFVANYVSQHHLSASFHQQHIPGVPHISPFSLPSLC